MAGVHLEFRRLLNKDSFLGIFGAASYSVILSSGNWLIGVLSIFIFSTVANIIYGYDIKTVIYQIYITYAIALSLIISGPFQLSFTRYVSDKIFVKDYQKILPNYMSTLFVCFSVSILLSSLMSLYLLEDKGYEYKFVFSLTVAILSCLWTTNALLTGLKSYRYITVSFLIGFLFTGFSLLWVIRYEIIWSFVTFYIGSVIILLLLTIRIVKEFPSTSIIDWEFFGKFKEYLYLWLAGFFYNAGIWIDKIIFWFSPFTGDYIFSNIRASVVYDIPIILSYLSLLPGIAFFFIKIEFEFAESYKKYYDAVREWGKLEDIYNLGNKLVVNAKNIVHEVLRIQILFTLFIILVEEHIFNLLKIPALYIPLFNILLIGALLQLTFMTIFALLSYFNRKKELFIATLTLFTFNVLLTSLTQFLGPSYYGYGYVISLLIASLVGMWMLGRFLNEIHYRTFMLGN